MSIDYTAIRAAATTMLETFGVVMTLKIAPVAADSYIADEGTIDQTPTTAPVVGVLLDFSDYERRNSNIAEGTRKALIGVGDLTARPKMGDLLNDGTDDWSVINVRTLSPANIDIMYSLVIGK